ncbi:ABC transporter substrate-binding protein [Microvirga makkahensis]|uniref:ABC transporter substrate-binding protein n=1 Tax=Microvirga makkahensis TaxID=1128670 RepID=A0A7X3SQS0_9HYPH|nr:ABC transporter substrate-binding protein [Microvirga makkahensis]MXQ13563.1 hypothetical protein [Microvirga makkahensis]
MGRSPCFAALALVPLASGVAAQTPAETVHLGMLYPVRCAGSGHTAFEDELRKLGWIEGHNLTIERRALEGPYERASELAAEIVRSRSDLIVGPSAPIARALKGATSEIPIAFSFVANPFQIGLVQSLAHPEHNVTGVAPITPGAFLARRFEILRELLPQAQRAAVLVNPANDDHRLALAREVSMVIQPGLRVDVIEIRAPGDIPEAIEKAKMLHAEGVLVLGDAILGPAPTNWSIGRSTFPGILIPEKGRRHEEDAL